MFLLRRAFQPLHEGHFLMLFFPVDCLSQSHEGNGLAAMSLLFQFLDGRYLGTVIDDSINHSQVILDHHLCRFKRILRKKAGNLFKADAVHIMARYHAVLFDGNDVADAQGRAVVICRTMQIELLVDFL